MQTLRASVATAKAMPARATEQLEVVLEVTRSVVYFSVIAVLTVALLTFVSVFMYGTFYFAFVPSPEHAGPLFPVFEPCEARAGKCGFLNASVALSERARAVLMTGQAYTVAVGVEMPESPGNRELGMFMNCVQLKGAEGQFSTFMLSRLFCAKWRAIMRLRPQDVA